MNKIVTALGNPKLNEELKKCENIKIIEKDIQYQEGIIELLEKNNNIDFLIISELIPGNNKLEILIEKIINLNKLIKIIIILENEDYNYEKYLLKIGAEKIFYNNKSDLKDIINFIENNNYKINNELKQINELKKIIENNSKKENNIKIKNIKIINIKKLIKNNLVKSKKNKTKEENNKIITILGNSGIGKSVFSVVLSKIMQKNLSKILIIDFDFLNNDLSTILGVKKYSEKIKKRIEKNKIEIKDLIIKINNKIDLISGINIIFNKNNKITDFEFRRIFYELKNNYDLIIIDSSSENFFEYNKKIIHISDLNLFLLEGNLLQVKKSQNLLKMYFEEWNIENEKIKIIINRYNKYSIDMKLIKLIFNNFEILGKINFNNYYNFIINKNSKNIFIKKIIKKDYLKIIKKIIKNNKKGGNNEFIDNVRRFRKQFS